MISLIRSTKPWLQSWLTRSKTVMETEEQWVGLPNALVPQLLQCIESLSSPPAYQASVQTAIATALESWQENLDTANSLVILGNPIEPIAQILRESVHNWDDSPPLEVITPFACLKRPHDPLAIAPQLQQIFQNYPQIDLNLTQQLAEDLEGLAERKTLMLIPALDQCFLRCIGGWEGIIWLRDLIVHNQHCFWVIGCNHWAWDFLDFVCQIRAYFNEVHSLPQLTGEMLQEWFEPMLEQLRQKGLQDKIQLSDDAPEVAQEQEQSYWEMLANQSSGVGQVAAMLWLDSLRISGENMADDEFSCPDLTSSKKLEEPFVLHKVRPSLPSLPSFVEGDRYLLHSMLIHGRISRAHLAFSLGEPESQIQASIQRLLREKMIERSGGALSIQAAHYAKLKSELANNNFFVGED